nr:hypothetical 12.6K protein - Pseudomonas aeruginosa [Pseudomonas aeruginosa]
MQMSRLQACSQASALRFASWPSSQAVARSARRCRCSRSARSSWAFISSRSSARQASWVAASRQAQRNLRRGSMTVSRQGRAAFSRIWARSFEQLTPRLPSQAATSNRQTSAPCS